MSFFTFYWEHAVICPSYVFSTLNFPSYPCIHKLRKWFSRCSSTKKHGEAVQPCLNLQADLNFFFLCSPSCHLLSPSFPGWCPTTPIPWHTSSTSTIQERYHPATLCLELFYQSQSLLLADLWHFCCHCLHFSCSHWVWCMCVYCVQRLSLVRVWLISHH